MNITPQNDLRHLFDGTHCLSKRQMRDYAASFSSSNAGSMSREEAYAVESHLNTCPLCSAAVDGMLAHFPESANVLATVDAGFLKDHFKKHSPQIHLNTVAPPASTPITRRIPGTGDTRIVNLASLRTLGIAAGVLLIIASLWWFQSQNDGGKLRNETALIAQAEAGANKNVGDGAATSMPEAERRLAQAAPANVVREQAGVEEKSEKKKSTEEILAEADAAVGSANSSIVTGALEAKPTSVAATAPAANNSATRADEAADDVAKLSPPRKLDEVRVSRYQRPLTEPNQPAARSVVTDKEIEKMPTRNSSDAVSTAPGVYQSRSGSSVTVSGGRSESTLYVVDGVQQIGNGKELYKRGEYTAALKIFKQQMASASGSAREEATLYAARCHRALGQEKAAEKLLQSLADGAGSRARAARRELRDMDGEYREGSPRRAKANKD